MSQLSVPTQPKFQSHTAARPMLARDADAVYWMSRYVERAEHVARLLLVNSNLLMDVGELAPDLQERQWQSVLTIMRSGELPQVFDAAVGLPLADAPLAMRAAQYMTFNP